MQKLECIQESLDLNFAEATSEINNSWADVNARLSILKSTTDDLKTSLDAAWVEIKALKQQDEQNRFQLAEFAKENAQLQAEVSATKARAIKLDNYTRRENIRLLDVLKSQDENCGVMAVVKMEGPNKVKFHAVHRIGKQRWRKALPNDCTVCPLRNQKWPLASMKGASQLSKSSTCHPGTRLCLWDCEEAKETVQCFETPEGWTFP